MGCDYGSFFTLDNSDRHCGMLCQQMLTKETLAQVEIWKMKKSMHYKTPAAAHLQTGELNKKWKKKKYPNKKKNDEENELYLQNRTTSQGEGICQQF